MWFDQNQIFVIIKNLLVQQKFMGPRKCKFLWFILLQNVLILFHVNLQPFDSLL